MPETLSLQGERGPVSGTGPEDELDAVLREIDALLDRRCSERCVSWILPARRSVMIPSFEIVAKLHRKPIMPGLHADAGAHALERPPPGIVFVGVVAEQGEMGGIGSRADAGRDGVHDPAASLGSEFVKDRCFCRGRAG